jgi:site-specific DNA recombinase
MSERHDDAVGLRAIAYVRVSSSGQADHGLGLQAQRQAIRDYVAETGITLLEVVSETASGAPKPGELFSLEHRPVLSELVVRAERGTFDVLLVATLDRLSRDQIEQLYLKRLLGNLGVAVVSAAGETNGNGDALSDLVDRLIGAVHDFDRKRIIERLKSGKKEARKGGRHTDGRPPFGYRKAAGGNPGRFVVDEPVGGTPIARRESPAGVVQVIFERAARDGLGPGPIARRLNAEKIPGPAGTPWNGRNVSNILKNPAYCGRLHGVRKAQPAIVSPQVWNAAQRVRRSEQ